MSEGCGAQQPGGRHTCNREANHWGESHRYKGYRTIRDAPEPEPVVWGQPAVRPAKITPEQATARWGKFPRKCARNDGRHRMVWTFPANMTGPRRFPVEYLGITQGTLCADCHAYDPRPVCCADVTREWASGRCLRHGVSYDPVPKGSGYGSLNIWEKASGTKSWYCAGHSPVLRAEKAAAAAVVRAEEDARRAAANAPFDEYEAAEEAVLVEAQRWREDEESTGEGFCETDCEHHECRLARAVRRYEDAMASVRGLRRQGRESRRNPHRLQRAT